jgi:hypothetical protein
MIFIEERIRPIDRRIAELVGPKRVSAGVVVYPQVWFRQDLRLRDGQHVHSISARIDLQEVEQGEAELIAKKVIEQLKKQREQLVEALELGGPLEAPCSCNVEHGDSECDQHPTCFRCHMIIGYTEGAACACPVPQGDEAAALEEQRA